MSIEFKEGKEARGTRTGFIFPLSAKTHNSKYVEQIIISYLDIDSKIKLSNVNSAARSILNSSEFKKLFIQEISKNYIFFKNFEIDKFKDTQNNKVFNYLMNTYSNSCWKVFCWVLSNPTRSFPVPRSNTEHTTKDYNNILHNLLKGWHTSKEELSCELKKIDGNCFQDPNSQIHKAWLIKVANETKIEELNNVIYQLEMTPIISELYENKINIFSEKEKEEFSQLLLNNTQEKKEEHISSIVKKINISDNDRDILIKYLISMSYLVKLKIESEKYYNLEIKKNNIKSLYKHFNEMISLNKEIKVGVFSEVHKLKLINSKDLIINFRCCELIEFVNNKEKNTELKNLINSCSTSGIVWRELYDSKAQNKIEDRWSENHFHEFPEKLFSILCLNAGNLYSNLSELALNKIPLSRDEKILNIRNLINSCSVSSDIWAQLYHQCAEGNIQTNWSENHFHAFPAPLIRILENLHNNSIGTEREKLMQIIDLVRQLF